MRLLRDLLHMAAIRRAGGYASCAKVRRLLQRYLDAEIDERKARRIAIHLEMCRGCGLEADTYASVKMALATLDLSSLDQGVLDRLTAFADAVPGPPTGLPGSTSHD